MDHSLFQLFKFILQLTNEKKALTREDCNYDNGWWTIDLTSGFFEMEKWDNHFIDYQGGKQNPYAQYHLIDTEDAKFLAIQIGEEGDPLPVYLKDSQGKLKYSGFTSNDPMDIYLDTGRFYEWVESDQDIYYTVNGTDPKDSTSPIKFDRSEAIHCKKNTVINARTKVGDKWGPLCVLKLYIMPKKPTSSLQSGSYFGEQTIELSHPSEDAKIYYTLDGTDPDDNSTMYEKGHPIVISSDTTLKAVAYQGTMSPSEILTCKYSFSEGLSIELDDPESGTWQGKQMLGKVKTCNLIMPFGTHSAELVAKIPESASLKVDDESVQKDKDSVYRFSLKAAIVDGKSSETELKPAEHVLTVTSGENSVDYTIYCIEACCDGLPDMVTDYLCIGSQYTNTALLSGSGFGGNVENTLAGGYGVFDSTSLGNFGGYATWFYKDGITNDSNNPYGIYFVVIGNSYDGTNEFAEPGNVLVSEDGKQWYTLAGSLHYDNSATWNQKITYSKSSAYSGMTDYDLDGVISGTFDQYPYPLKEAYPEHSVDDDFNSYTTRGTLLHADMESNEFGNTRPSCPAFGYADIGYSNGYSNEAETPYGGLMRAGMVDYKYYEYRVLHGRNGDGFDLEWAVNDNGEPVKLDTVHYVKIQTATCIKNNAIGEKSTEICCIRKAKSDDESVGVTSAPDSIEFDGKIIEGSSLVAGSIQDVNVDGIFDVKVNTHSDANVYINSVNNNVAFFNKAPHKIVRVIVQEGRKAPAIYYFNVVQTEQPSTKKVTKVTLDATDGIMHDKMTQSYYLDEDTLDHFGGSEITLDEPDPESKNYAFIKWVDNDDNSYTKIDKGIIAEGKEIVLKAVYGKASEVLISKVEALIDALPAPSAITEGDTDDVKAAKDAFDGLSDEDKAQISVARTSKLFEATAAIYKIEAEKAESRADALQEKVTALEADAADAAQKVAEAEAKLKELQESGEADKETIKKAEEELTAAKKAQAEAEAKLKKAQEDLATAEKKTSESEAVVKQVTDSYEKELAVLKAQNAILKKTVKKVKAKAKKKSALVSWKSVGKGFTYEVYRSKNPTKSFKKVKALKKLKVTVKKLKKGKTYYFKVRAFKKVNGKKVYTGWSNIAKAKIKK